MLSKILTPGNGSERKLAMWNPGPGLPVIRVLHKDADGNSVATDFNDLTKEEISNLAEFLNDIASRM